MGSVVAQKKYCRSSRPLNPPARVRLSNGAVVLARETGVIRVPAKVDDGTPVYFGNVIIYLVEDEKWSDLLIGHKVLTKFESLLEHRLAQLPEIIRTKLRK